ncbi:hypothetical protein MHYP_G00113480 [Metynnis hypsauchen]
MFSTTLPLGLQPSDSQPSCAPQACGLPPRRTPRRLQLSSNAPFYLHQPSAPWRKALLLRMRNYIASVWYTSAPSLKTAWSLLSFTAAGWCGASPTPPASQQAQLCPGKCPRGRGAKCAIFLITAERRVSSTVSSYVASLVCPAGMCEKKNTSCPPSLISAFPVARFITD